MPPTYRRLHAAEDVFKFMVGRSVLFSSDVLLTNHQEALHLPPCHLVGLSLGACVALQTAISYPHQVLSLFMVSPLPLIEVGPSFDLSFDLTQPA